MSFVGGIFAAQPSALAPAIHQNAIALLLPSIWDEEKCLDWFNARLESLHPDVPAAIPQPAGRPGVVCGGPTVGCLWLAAGRLVLLLRALSRDNEALHFTR